MAANPQIAAFVAAQTQYNAESSAELDGIVTDLDTLNATIERLQNTPPVLDPGDQTLLDDIQEQSRALRDRLKAQNERTPPTPPTPA